MFNTLTRAKENLLKFQKQLRDTRHRLWLNLAKLGNEDAFRRLYRELYSPIVSFVGVRVGNSHDAEDIVSSIFMRFLQNLSSYCPAKGSVLTWTLTMAHHAVVDYHRRLVVRENSSNVEATSAHQSQISGLPLCEPEGDTLSGLIRQEELRRVQEILTNQGPIIREIYNLRYGQELKIREIAQVMELSEAAVKQRLSRTNRLLRGKLQATPSQLQSPQGGPPCTATD